MNNSYIYRYNSGFSLIEIVLSLLILSGSIVVIFSGFDTSDKLNNYSIFETKAAFLAERELEILKSDLINKNRKNFPGTADSRFQQQPGWKVKCIWTVPDKTDVVRVVSSVTYKGMKFRLESFVFIPNIGAKSAFRTG